MISKVNISQNTQKVLLWGSVALVLGIVLVVVKKKKDKKLRIENEKKGLQKEYEGLLQRIDKAPK